MRPVAAIILAAGEAKRFRSVSTGTKLVAGLEGKPLVRHVAEAALASRARPVLAVIGHAYEEVVQALTGLDLQFIQNHDPAAGLSVSLKLAIAALPGSARGAVILLGDMPLIPSSLIDRLVEAFDTAAAEPLAVVPVRGARQSRPPWARPLRRCGHTRRGQRREKSPRRAARRPRTAGQRLRDRDRHRHARRFAPAAWRPVNVRPSRNTGGIFVPAHGLRKPNAKLCKYDTY